MIIHKKEWEGLLYENGAGKKKFVGHSKQKLWTFFWGHGEREWPLLVTYWDEKVPKCFIALVKCSVLSLLTATNNLTSCWQTKQPHFMLAPAKPTIYQVFQQDKYVLATRSHGQCHRTPKLCCIMRLTCFVITKSEWSIFTCTYTDGCGYAVIN